MNRLIKQAFTLIELLVVIAIIGILSGLIIVGMSGMTQKANIAKAQVFSNSLKNSLLMSIVGEWKFDGATSEGAATNADVVDTWGGVNNGDVLLPTAHQPTIKIGSNCVSGSCLSFDGIDDYVYFGAGSNLLFADQVDWTATYWIYPINTTWNVLSSYNNHSYRYLMTHTNGSVYFKSNSGNYYGSADNIINLNIWQHLVVACTGSSRTLSIYVNGIYKGTLSPDNSMMGFSYLGMGSGSTRFQLGSIDDVRIYNAAMPTSQIKEQYYAGLNKLLANGGITKEEYQNRIGELAIGL